MMFNLMLTLFILIEYPMQVDTIIMELSILYFKRSPIKKFFKMMCNVFLSLKIVLSRNSADPVGMPSYVTFHLCLHCLPMYLFTSIQTEKSLSFNLYHTSNI